MSSGRRRCRGFTLLELIVVVAIIATLAGVVGPSLLGHVGQAKSTAARSQLEILAMALDAFYLDVQRYPTTSEGLLVLRERPADANAAARWRGPYLRSALPQDPWQNEWHYEARSGPSTPFILVSYGRDGVPGGEGEDADVDFDSSRTAP